MFKYLITILMLVLPGLVHAQDSWTPGEIIGDFVYRTGDSGNGWIPRLHEATGFPDHHYERGLKVMWWNLGCIKDHQIDHLHPGERRNEAPHNLRKNMQRLLSGAGVRPDVLILGEYCANALKEGSNGYTRLLNEFYPHQEVIDQYTPYHDENGIRIFSRYKINDYKVIRPHASGWLNGNRLSKCARGEETKDKYQKGRYRFPILEFNISKAGKDYQVVGTHSPNPWNLIEECGNKLRAKVHVAWQMIVATTNPAYKYANDVRKRYQNSNRTLVIGDFNAPKKIRIKIGFFRFSFVSKPYRLLAKYLGSSIVKSQKETAVAQKVGKDRAYSIDHAFASGDLKVDFAEVIPLAGSDHLPLYVVINQP